MCLASIRGEPLYPPHNGRNNLSKQIIAQKKKNPEIMEFNVNGEKLKSIGSYATHSGK